MAQAASKPMTKTQLVAAVADAMGGDKKTANAALDAIAAVVSREVAAGGTVLDREVVSRLVRASEPAGGRADLAELTPRELDVLQLMAEGRTNAGIAAAMVVSLGAVEKHVTSIFSKLDLPAGGEDHRRVLAVLTYLRSGEG